MKLSLRAKFLILSAVVQGLVVGLLIWNSLRIMDHAVTRNSDRVAHEYAVTLNLSLRPYAASGRLADLNSYLQDMLAAPHDSFLRYIVVRDDRGAPLITAGQLPAHLPELGMQPDASRPASGVHSADKRLGLETMRRDSLLHARMPLDLQGGRRGSINFGLSTSDLARVREEVLGQGSVITIVGFVVGLLLFYAFTVGIGRRIGALTAQSQRLARGDYGTLLAEQGGDEIEIVSRSMNTMNLALRERIAQLDQAEQRLLESEARFKILFELAPVPLAVTDRKGIVIAANLALMRTFDIGASAILGKNASDLALWESDEERERILFLYRRDGALQGQISQVRMADGSAGSVAIWSSSLSLDGARAMIWALLDLTAELNAKRELKELNTSLESRVRQRSAELEQANTDLSLALETLQRTQHELLAAEKMASLGSLVAGVAHELNTPIGNSLLASTALADRVAAFNRVVADGTLRRSALLSHLEEVQQASKLISGSLHKAANLISSFKQIAVDQTSDQRRRFDLLLVLQDTLATYMPRLRLAACTVTLDIPSGLMLDSYPGSLYQVMNNLINNSLMHAFDGKLDGAIVIRAREVAANMVELEFSDDGAGMSEDVLHRVFDPFFTTRMGQGGTGLGMNIVYNIVSGVLGGRIDIKSTPGQGTRIRITMPKAAPQRERDAAAAQ
jgi:PAS domain S-box-containing protein